VGKLQGSGVELPPAAAAVLEELWANRTDTVLFRSPDELPSDGSFPEGSVVRAEVNRYERDARARAACLAHWGPRCSVCGLNFEECYGAIGRGFIHVHHLRELSSVGADYRVDPISDLRPVCPNCHAMLHRRRPALSIDELRTHLRSSD
jgi:5-methylcytosine-specific restriction enzyme A